MAVSIKVSDLPLSSSAGSSDVVVGNVSGITSQISLGIPGGISLYGQPVELSPEVASSEISVTGTAQTVTRSEGATSIELYVLEGLVNLRADGSAATATTGRPFGAGSYILLNSATASVIRRGTSDATVRLVNGTVA